MRDHQGSPAAPVLDDIEDAVWRARYDCLRRGHDFDVADVMAAVTPIVEDLYKKAYLTIRIPKRFQRRTL